MKSLVFIFLLAGGCGVAVGLTREYFFNNTPSDWYSAQKACKVSYKDLAIINSTEENNRALQSGSGSDESWIGLNTDTPSGTGTGTWTWTWTGPGIWTGTWTWTGTGTGTWLWSDGETPSFTNWDNFYYPPNSNPNFNCQQQYNALGTLSPHQGLWRCHYNNNPRTFYCYRYLILVQENMTWDEAYEYCRTNYTGLASVTSETSLRQLNVETAQTQTESVWTGLRFMNGIWFWVSGEQLGSLVSLSSCPALPYHCGSLNNKTNTLEKRNCNDRLNFVCYLQ